MKFYTIDDATEMLTQFDITHSKQMVLRWVRDSILIAEKIDLKYMISEENLFSFIEQKKPKMIQLIEQTIVINQRMEILFEKLVVIEEQVSKIDVDLENLNEIKQLLTTILENTNKNNYSRKQPVKKKKIDEGQLTMEYMIDNHSEAESVLQEEQEENLRVYVKNELNESVQERNHESSSLEVKKDMDELVQEDKVTNQINENDQVKNKSDSINELPFTDAQIMSAMGEIDARIFSYHKNAIFNEIKKTLIDQISKWYFPSEKQRYKCLYGKKHFASAIPFLKSTAMHISKKWNK